MPVTQGPDEAKVTAAGDNLIGRVKITDGTDVALVDSSGNLMVNVAAGGAAGTQYTEGDTDASITGTAMLWEDTSDTLRAVSAAKPLPISVATIPSHAVTNAGTFAVQSTFGGTRSYKTVSGSLSSDTDVITAVSSKRLKVYALALTTTSATEQTIIFKSDGTGGTEVWRYDLQSPSSVMQGANLSVSPGLDGAFLFATAAGKKLTADISGSGTIHYSLSYWDDDAS